MAVIWHNDDIDVRHDDHNELPQCHISDGNAIFRADS